MVNTVETLCVGNYDVITKKKARAHVKERVKERNVENYMMCLVVTKNFDMYWGKRVL